MKRELLVRAWGVDEALVSDAAARAQQPVALADDPQALLHANIAIVSADRLDDVPDLRRPPLLEAGPLVLVVSDRDDDLAELAARVNYVASPTPGDLGRQLALACARAPDRLLSTLALRLADNHHEAVEFVDRDFRLIRVNHTWEQMTGYFALLRSDVHPQGFYENIEREAVAGGWSGEIVSRDVNGQHFVNLVRIVEPVCIGDRVVGMLGMRLRLRAGDLDGDDSVEGTLGTIGSAQLYSRLVAAADDGILILDGTTLAVIDSNPAGLRLLGVSLEDLRKLTLRDLVPSYYESHVDALVRQLSGVGGAELDRLEMIGKDGETFHASVRISSLVVQGRHLFAAVVRDVSTMIEREAELARTHKRLLEEQRRTQRAAQLATLGELAAGVAHEVNNPAGFVLLNLEHLKEMLDSGELVAQDARVPDILEECVTGMQRIGTITRELLPFAATAVDATPAPVDVTEEVERALRIVDNEVRHRGTLERELHKVPRVMSTPGRISQLLTNLVINAAHALDEGKARDNRIVVTVAPDSGGVLIKVSDTGEGIPESLHDRIFDRFFTTKKRGKGTGLGLALCAELIYEMDGHIDVQSQVGRGSTFRVWLPSAPDLPTEAKPATPLAPTAGERRRVLVIDDEPQLLAVQSRMLGRVFDVEQANSGREALNALSRDDRFDAVLCDLMMPDVDGAAVYEAIARQHPQLLPRLVFQSGGVFHDRLNRFLNEVDTPVLAKPVSRDVLIETLERVARR
jgi:PAS domain S-box-containing protein